MTSLAVQRLRLCVSTAGGVGLIPGQGTKIPHAAQCSQSKTKHTNSPSPLPQPLAPALLLSFSMNLTPLGTSPKWNQTAFVFLWLAYFTGITSSRFTHVIACVRLSFLFKAE